MVASRKDAAPKWRPATIQTLRHYQYWQPNVFSTLSLLVVDIDRDDALDHFYSVMTHHNLPQPTYLIQNTTGHVHAVWAIEPVCTAANARWKPQGYARDVWRALTAVFGADWSFNMTGGRSLNPYWSGWHAKPKTDEEKKKAQGRVIWAPDTTPYKLGTLKDALRDADVWTTKREPGTSVKRFNPFREFADPGDSRNRYVFDCARLRRRGTVEEAAVLANDGLEHPLGGVELNGIIRSIEKWEATHHVSGGKRLMTDEERRLQAVRGRIGGSRNTEAQQQARATGPRSAAVVRSAERIGNIAQAVALRQQGMTRAQIAKTMKVHPDTVKSYIREARRNGLLDENGIPTGIGLDEVEYPVSDPRTWSVIALQDAANLEDEDMAETPASLIKLIDVAEKFDDLDTS